MIEMPSKRPLSANDIADWFINATDGDAGNVITPLMVQKLVFFAQAWFLANKGRPLFTDDFQAWASGPIIPALFERFENFAYTNLPPIENARQVSGEKLELLNGVQERYGCFNAGKLEQLVQESGGPWSKCRAGLGPGDASSTVITKDAIKKFYGQKIDKTWT